LFYLHIISPGRRRRSSLSVSLLVVSMAVACAVACAVAWRVLLVWALLLWASIGGVTESTETNTFSAVTLVGMIPPPLSYHSCGAFIDDSGLTHGVLRRHLF
jgi:hypothetical protein